MVQSAIDQLESIDLVIGTLNFDPPPGGAKGHRVKVSAPKPDGERSSKTSGVYRVYEYTTRNGDVLVFGWGRNYKSGEFVKVSPDDNGNMEKADLEALRKQRAQAARDAEEERKAKAKSAAERARAIWPKLPGDGGSEYLTKKGVSGFGVGYAKGCVVVPVRQASDDALVGLQWIQPDGSKRFLTGTPKQGACHFIGQAKKNGSLLVCEGYATGASLHQATGLPVAVAFDAGNLEPVATALKKRPDVRMRTLVVAADNDHETAGNPGVSKARAAAEAVRGAMIQPTFEQAAGKSDFNDMHHEVGLPALREYLTDAVRRALKHAGWKQQLQRGEKSQLVGGLHNLQLILEHDERVEGLLRLDEFANRVEFTRDPPFGGGSREVSDNEVVELAAWYGQPSTYSLNVPTNNMHDVVAMVAARNKVHPVREYLRALTWDGTERIPKFFPDYCEAEGNEYTAAAALNFFIAAVARVMRPGCKSDLMLILEGRQGAGKSRAIEMLAGTQWFAVQSEAPENKDFYQILQGRWIVEIAELQSFSKAQVSRVKQAISTPVDVYRASYGRMPKEYPRQCVFVGSTNEDEYLRDPTGARRFMPVRVGEVDLEALRLNRDQLWAEAVRRFDAGETWWEMPAQADDEREARYRHDAWAEPIFDWLDGRADIDSYPHNIREVRHECDLSEVMTYALGLDRARQSMQEQMRVGAILKHQGWEKRQARRNGRRKWLYERPESDPMRTSAGTHEREATADEAF